MKSSPNEQQTRDPLHQPDVSPHIADIKRLLVRLSAVIVLTMILSALIIAQWIPNPFQREQRVIIVGDPELATPTPPFAISTPLAGNE